MKYTLFFLAILAILQIAAAQVEAIEEDLDDEIVDVEHFSDFGHHDFHKFPHKFPHKKVPHKKVPHKKVPHKKVPHKHFIYKPHKKICFKPTLTAHLVKVIKHYDCPWYKPFGFKIIIVFKTKYHTFTFIIKICSYKHSILLPKKIFKCSLDLALKKCKFIGLPKCVHHKKWFLGRKKILGKCLLGVLKKCSKHGKVLFH